MSWGELNSAGREVMIELACDADYQRLAGDISLAGTVTIAEALEVLDD